MDLLSTILAAGGGTITGAVGGIATSYFQMKLEEARIPLQMQEVALKRYEAETQLEAVEITQEGETNRAEIAAQAKTFEAAHSSDKATYEIFLVDAVRGLVRPAITTWVVFVLSYITYMLWDLKGESIDSIFWRELFRHLIVTWTYLTSTVVMFWFGQRQSRPSPVMK